jgi:hypothetical protein
MQSQRSYPLYGGRGIVVHERWHDFPNFRADMGECPEGYSLDRINNDGNYEPGNCRWLFLPFQAANKRNNHLLTYQGQTHTLAEWGRRTGLKSRTLRCRIEVLGWSVERALTAGLVKGRPRA